jgi:hypothetical protein
MNEEIRLVLQHGPIGPHAAAGGIDPPALPGGIARPDERYRTFVRGRGAEMSSLGFARHPGFADILEPHPVKDVLAGRQTLQQRLRGEVMIRPRVRRCGADHGLETFDRGIFHPHARGPVGPRPYHRGAVRHIARLNPARDARTIRRAAEMRPGETSHACQRDGGS